MIWLALLVLTAVTLAPLGWTFWHGTALRSRREAALALHHAQLDELDRDLEHGRIAPPEHAQARLEVQRRLLSEAEGREAEPGRTTGAPLVVVLILVPAGALGLYLLGGHPGLPAEPLSARASLARQEQARDAALLDELRVAIGKLDPHSEQARQGYAILGQAEASRGHFAEAADAWNRALAIRFDPTLAAETGAAMTETSGRVSEQAAALFRRALAEAPADAPWRPMAEKQLQAFNPR